MPSESDVAVGVLHSLTGPMSVSERSLVEAAGMAIDEINLAGGILGRRIHAIVKDGASEPEKFANHAREMIQTNHVVSLFGCWTSDSRKAVKSVVEELNALLWYPVQYEGLEESEHIVYTGCCLNQQIEPAVRWLLEQGKRRCLLVGSDYVFPRVANGLIASMVSAAGGSVVSDFYFPLGGVDFSALAAQLPTLMPDAIFNTLNGESNFAFFRQIHAAGVRSDGLPIMSFSLAEGEQAVIAKEGMGHHTCWSYFESLDIPENRAFVRRFQQRFGESSRISDPVVAAYSQVFLWKQAVERAQSFDPEAVNKSVVGLRYESPGGLIEIQHNRHVKKTAYIGRGLKDGQFEVVWRSDAQIEPKPWLGVEDLDLPTRELIKGVLQQFPQAIYHANQLESEIALRKVAEGELKETTERLNLAQSVADIAIWDWNLLNDRAWVNEEYRSICDLPPAVCPSYQSFLTQVLPEDRADYEAVVRRALSGGGDIDAECRIRGAQDGKIRWLRSRGKVFFDEYRRPVRAMGALWEITAFKQAQEVLLEKAEVRYRRIVETSLEGIWLIDRQAKTTFVNDRMAKMLGYLPEEMRWRVLTDFTDNEWKPVAEEKLIARERGDVEALDFKFKRKDGSDLWTLLSCRPVFDNGNDGGALLMVTDFTERQRLQDQIKQNMRLLEENDRRKNEFMATLAHELRNPLATINLATEFVSANLETATAIGDEDRAALKRAVRQGKHLARLVADLVEVSRITTGKIELNRTTVDLVTLVPQAVELIQEKVNKKGLALSMSLPDEPLMVSGDSVRLIQVFCNLLDNAVKFTSAGGRVELKAMREGSEAIVVIRDNGVGIEKEQLSSIFELFHQMKHGADRNVEGLGIGLALSRQLVKLHGGEIDAQSEGVGRGSEFTVRLPLAAAPQD